VVQHGPWCKGKNMTIVLNGTTGITNDGGYTGDGVVFADTTPANTLVTTTGGNVGIGTSSPTTRLEVSGAFGTSTTGITLSNSTSFNASNIARFDFRVNNSFGGLERIADIWALNPNAAANNGGALVFGTSANGTATTPTERMRLDSSGNVGIGTSSPSRKLEVSSNDAQTDLMVSRTSNGLGAILRWDNTAGAAHLYTNGAYPLLFGTNNTERARIDTSGNLLVGTTSNPSSYRALINGSLSASGSVSFPQSNNDTTAAAANMNIQGDGFLRRSTSALKYKQDIRDLESKDISALRPVRYKSKCAGDDQTKDHFGLIADEAADAGFEELVTRGSDGEVEGFQYERLTVVLVKAIQEQQAIITDQDVKMGQLVDQLTNAESTMNLLTEMFTESQQTVAALAARVEALEGTQP
jgi:hypothetical protein